MAPPSERLRAIQARHDVVLATLNAGPDPEAFVSLSRELAELEPVVAAIRSFDSARENLEGLDTMIRDPKTDAEMRSLAQDERPQAQEEVERRANELRLLLLPKDAADQKSAILEVRAGTGGDEAALFAGDLFRMYARYAELKGWRVEVLSESEGTMGGYKEIVAQIKGVGVFARLKFESGVHRVQRVPQTETQGRIHTSAATVAVLPEAEEVDVAIDEADLKVDTMRAQGAGGQHVNKTESAIRITHVPTGTVVFVQEERSQHKNRDFAMKMLKSRLYTYYQELEKARQAGLTEPKKEINFGSQIRSYVLQ